MSSPPLKESNNQPPILNRQIFNVLNKRKVLKKVVLERSDEINPLVGVDLPLRPKVPQEIEIRPIKMRQRVKESIDSFFGYFSG